MRTDSELIRAFQKGDPEAFRKLYAQCKDSAFFYAITLSGSEVLAEEAVQEAFIYFIERFRTYRWRGSFKTYLYTLIRSRIIDAIRKKRSRREVSGDANPDLFQGSSGETEDHELQADVSRALLALPPEQREAVILKVYDGMTFKEIAHVVGEGESTVASRYRYGCTKLKHLLERTVEDG